MVTPIPWRQLFLKQLVFDDKGVFMISRVFNTSSIKEEYKEEHYYI